MNKILFSRDPKELYDILYGEDLSKDERYAAITALCAMMSNVFDRLDKLENKAPASNG